MNQYTMVDEMPGDFVQYPIFPYPLAAEWDGIPRVTDPPNLGYSLAAEPRAPPPAIFQDPSAYQLRRPNAAFKLTEARYALPGTNATSGSTDIRSTNYYEPPSRQTFSGNFTGYEVPGRRFFSATRPLEIITPEISLTPTEYYNNNQHLSPSYACRNNGWEVCTMRPPPPLYHEFGDTSTALFDYNAINPNRERRDPPGGEYSGEVDFHHMSYGNLSRSQKNHVLVRNGFHKAKYGPIEHLFKRFLHDTAKNAVLGRNRFCSPIVPLGRQATLLPERTESSGHASPSSRSSARSDSVRSCESTSSNDLNSQFTNSAARPHDSDASSRNSIAQSHDSDDSSASICSYLSDVSLRAKSRNKYRQVHRTMNKTNECYFAAESGLSNPLHDVSYSRRCSQNGDNDDAVNDADDDAGGDADDDVISPQAPKKVIIPPALNLLAATRSVKRQDAETAIRRQRTTTSTSASSVSCDNTENGVTRTYNEPTLSSSQHLLETYSVQGRAENCDVPQHEAIQQDFTTNLTLHEGKAPKTESVDVDKQNPTETTNFCIRDLLVSGSTTLRCKAIAIGIPVFERGSHPTFPIDSCYTPSKQPSTLHKSVVQIEKYPSISVSQVETPGSSSLPSVSDPYTPKEFVTLRPLPLFCADDDLGTSDDSSSCDVRTDLASERSDLTSRIETTTMKTVSMAGKKNNSASLTPDRRPQSDAGTRIKEDSVFDPEEETSCADSALVHPRCGKSRVIHCRSERSRGKSDLASNREDKEDITDLTKNVMPHLSPKTPKSDVFARLLVPKKIPVPNDDLAQVVSWEKSLRSTSPKKPARSSRIPLIHKKPGPATGQPSVRRLSPLNRLAKGNPLSAETVSSIKKTGENFGAIEKPEIARNTAEEPTVSTRLDSIFDSPHNESATSLHHREETKKEQQPSGFNSDGRLKDIQHSDCGQPPQQQRRPFLTRTAAFRTRKNPTVSTQNAVRSDPIPSLFESLVRDPMLKAH